MQLQRYLEAEPYTLYFSSAYHPFTRMIDVEAGEQILGQGDLPEYLHLMIQGRCSISNLLPSGKAVILNVHRAPCLIGEIELVRNDLSSFTVKALEKCRLLSLPLSSCRERLLGDVHFLCRLCADLTEKERSDALSYIRISAFPLENRLAHFILENQQDGVFRVTKVMAAESLGVSYRQMENVMRSLVERGCLSKCGRTYIIKDQARLLSLARKILDV